MGSESALRLPILDFSSLNQLEPGTPEWVSKTVQVKKALEEYGCFEVVYDEFHTDIREKMFGAIAEMFNLPVETKSLNQLKEPFHGFKRYESIPLFESMGIDDPQIFEEVKAFSKLMWPNENDIFCNTIHLFAKLLAEFDEKSRRMVLESLGVDKYSNNHIKSTYYHLRLMKYKAPKVENVEIGLNPHTDKGIMTMVHANQIGGLEVQTKDGKWINVNISPNSFVCLIGDSFGAWTNGRLHIPVHRVMMTGQEVRYSLALLSIPRGGQLVKAPQELVDEDHHPLLFKPFDFEEFINSEHTTRRGLKTYCGV
ncbi:hypothetical protein GIB67_033454 [Kingdonia uniflora]|uniref:2-oxoglutarate-dependent dioxygenase DAO n=1 Tax=Kingdonia uniflora TaxID=39325 RepID=A0A7J7LTX0_9MAGN|nr:hypothetical protein GIB67_033454 [Kingdonia uniflora]